MEEEVTVIFEDTVWHDVVRSQGLPSGATVLSGVWAQLARAALITQEKPVPAAVRVATFTRQQAADLERWLVEVGRSADAPASMGAALHSVREGIRLAK